MSIAPIVRSVQVAVPPERAFALFTARMDRWWKPDMHIAAEPFAEVVIEPRAGGRWFERAASGAECDWGVVLAWEPPRRVLLGWQITAAFRFDADFLTELEVTFAAEAGGTRVTLTHRDLERFGARADETRAKLDGGWPRLLQLFAAFTAEEDGQ